MRLFSTFLLGVATGLRSMSGPAAALNATNHRRGSAAPATLLGKLDAPTVFAMLAVAEMVADKLPFMPDRKAPASFAWRVALGALSAAAVTRGKGSLPLAILVGGAGAAAGTMGGSALRSGLATLFDRDFPAALVEDALLLAVAAVAAKGLEAGEPASPEAA
jgi:uncharacterized membrane protein